MKKQTLYIRRSYDRFDNFFRNRNPRPIRDDCQSAYLILISSGFRCGGLFHKTVVSKRREQFFDFQTQAVVITARFINK